MANFGWITSSCILVEGNKNGKEGEEGRLASGGFCMVGLLSVAEYLLCFSFLLLLKHTISDKTKDGSVEEVKSVDVEVEEAICMFESRKNLQLHFAWITSVECLPPANFFQVGVLKAL